MHTCARMHVFSCPHGHPLSCVRAKLKVTHPGFYSVFNFTGGRRFCSRTRHVYHRRIALFAVRGTMDHRTWCLQNSRFCRHPCGILCPSFAQCAERKGSLLFKSKKISSWAVFRFDNTDNVSILKIQNHNHNSKSKNQLLFLPYLQRVNFLSGAFVSVTFFFKWTEILTFIILFIIELSMVKTQNRRKRPCPHDDSINHKNYTFLVSRCVIGFERSCIFY